jgi:ATP-binding cassette subfamily B protein/subfamily B ATP-binding cassette protein MsbA
VKSLLRSLRYLRPYRRLAVLVVVLIVLAGLADLLAPWPLKILVDHVLGDHPLPGPLARMGWANDRSLLLIVVVAAGLAVALVGNGLTVLNNYAQTTLEQRMVLDFRSELFQHAQRLSMSFHDRRRAGMLIYTINSQGASVAGLLMAVPALAQSLITLLGMFWIVFHMDRGLALLSLSVVPFLFYSVRYYVTHIQRRLMHVKRMEGESLSIVHEAVSMLRVIVAFGREAHEYRRFRDQGEKAVGARVNVTVRQTLFSLVVNMTTAAGTALVLGFGAYQVLRGRVSIGDLLVVMAYIAAVYKPLETITYTIGTLQEKVVSQQVAFNLLSTQPDVKEAHDAIHVERALGEIAFEQVDFSYVGRPETLTDISFEARPGQVIGIVGPTGAGKTTLVSLIPRFYDVSRGRILLDGADIRGLALRSLREQVSLVLQEPLLFSGTIADNIRYGRLDADMDQVVEAAQAANAHEFIMRLPKQYETELGEGGRRLSVGERQRICVARAVLKDAPILILDEPTSSIDSRTEAVILDALDRLMVGRTTFLIAHRLSTIHRADMILVLDHGRLVQQGSHESLLEQGGLYRQLYEMQSRQRRASRQPFKASS